MVLRIGVHHGMCTDSHEGSNISGSQRVWAHLLVVGEAVAERSREEVHGVGSHRVGDAAVTHAVRAVAVGDVVGVVALRKVIVCGHNVHRVHVRVVAKHCRQQIEKRRNGRVRQGA